MKLVSQELGSFMSFMKLISQNQEFHDFHETNFTNIFLDIWFHELVSYVFFLWFPNPGSYYSKIDLDFRILITLIFSL